MSLWLQSAIETLSDGDYRHFRRELIPRAPVPIPECLMKEMEYGERCCVSVETDRLFPIRFIWLLEALEQKRPGGSAGGRSRYHPEKLLEMWERVSGDENHRRDLISRGFRFDFDERAIHMTAGWILMGNSFPEDLMDVETAGNVRLLFPFESARDLRPVFQNRRKRGKDP